MTCSPFWEAYFFLSLLLQHHMLVPLHLNNKRGWTTLLTLWRDKDSAYLHNLLFFMISSSKMTPSLANRWKSRINTSVPSFPHLHINLSLSLENCASTVYQESYFFPRVPPPPLSKSLSFLGNLFDMVSACFCFSFMYELGEALQPTRLCLLKSQECPRALMCNRNSSHDLQSPYVSVLHWPNIQHCALSFPYHWHTSGFLTNKAFCLFKDSIRMHKNGKM